MAREAGKGSARRPAQVTEEEVQDSWDSIFPKKKKFVPTGPTPEQEAALQAMVDFGQKYQSYDDTYNPLVKDK